MGRKRCRHGYEIVKWTQDGFVGELGALNLWAQLPESYLILHQFMKIASYKDVWYYIDKHELCNVIALQF
jgi:hypothetical protein